MPTITLDEILKEVRKIGSVISDMHWDHTFHPEKISGHFTHGNELVDNLCMKLAERIGYERALNK